MVVEDGTGLPDADSYSSLADADAYHVVVGNTAWADAASDAREAALVAATRWIESKYRTRWIGFKATQDQGLSWPRWDAVDPDGYELAGVPRRVAHATAEVALLVITGEELSPPQERGGRVKREKVGPIETEYAEGAPAGTAYPAISGLLRGLVHGPGLRITV
ncbi:MAG: DnaT-like ssDNA-binding protein [Alkalispirochaeta sp.]